MLASIDPGKHTIADKGYDADHLRFFLDERGTTPVIPNKSNRTRRFPFDGELYRLRNVIERTFCRLKDFRAIATRSDKTARNFLAGLCLIAALCYWINCVQTLRRVLIKSSPMSASARKQRDCRAAAKRREVPKTEVAGVFDDGL